MVIGLVLGAAIARADDPALPIRELDHPRYLDAVDRPVTWEEVHDLARPTGALRQVALRRAGRTAIRVALFAATAVEVWGTIELARDESWVALPVGIQAGFTGLAGILSITGAPGARVEDRAIVLNAVNDRARNPFTGGAR